MLGIPHILQNGNHGVEVMAVNGADVIKAKLFKQCPARQHAARIFIGAPCCRLHGLGKFLCHLFCDITQRQEGPRRNQPREIIGKCANGGRNRHAIIIQDDNESRIQRPGVVHRLVSHAGTHGSIADHANDVVVLAAQVARHRHAKARRNRGRTVGRAKRVKIAFPTLGKTIKPVTLPDFPDFVATSRENFVRIGLVADIPDHPVVRCFENVMQGNSKLDNT